MFDILIFGGIFLPLISVIVPVFNVEKYLCKCIDSILNQTYKNLEIILIDDGSTDKSGTICDTYTKKDSRIKVIHQNNEGLSAARNAGLDIAKGDYISFIDSDDFIDPDMFDVLLCNLEKNKADICACGFKKVYNDTDSSNSLNKFLEYNKTFSRHEAMESLCENKIINFSVNDKLFKKSLFNDLRFTEGIIFEDMDLVYKLIDKSNKIFFICEPKYNYRIRQGSILHGNFSTKKMELISVYKQFLGFISKKYPDLLNKAKCYFLELCLINLFDVLGSNEKFEKEKNELIILALKTYKEVKNSEFLSEKLKFKILALKVNAKFYYYLYSLFLKIKSN